MSWLVTTDHPLPSNQTILVMHCERQHQQHVILSLCLLFLVKESDIAMSCLSFTCPSYNNSDLKCSARSVQVVMCAGLLSDWSSTIPFTMSTLFAIDFAVNVAALFLSKPISALFCWHNVTLTRQMRNVILRQQWIRVHQWILAGWFQALSDKQPSSEQTKSDLLATLPQLFTLPLLFLPVDFYVLFSNGLVNSAFRNALRDKRTEGFISFGSQHAKVTFKTFKTCKNCGADLVPFSRRLSYPLTPQLNGQVQGQLKKTLHEQ